MPESYEYLPVSVLDPDVQTLVPVNNPTEVNGVRHKKRKHSFR